MIKDPGHTMTSGLPGVNPIPSLSNPAFTGKPKDGREDSSVTPSQYRYPLICLIACRAAIRPDACAKPLAVPGLIKL